MADRSSRAATLAATSRADLERLDRRLATDITSIYDELTEGGRHLRRLADVVYGAAELLPGWLPSRADIEEERRHLQTDKAGLELAQGVFVSRLLADERCGRHVLHAMSQPHPDAVARLGELEQTGQVDLGPVRVDRRGRAGHVTIQNHAFLNSEDDTSTAALEVAVDLVLLDDGIDVGVLRGGPATHPKHAGRRIFGSGINLTHLYQGQISLVEFMLERELGLVSKLYRGHSAGSPDDVELEHRHEKAWIAAVESFAIGGACQWLLVMDWVVAERGSYFNLPARKEGIIPGCANLRLPRLVGDRLAHQAIFANLVLEADTPTGRLLADEVVEGDEVDAAIDERADRLTDAGLPSLLANRKALRVGQEPLDAFRRYLANYAIEQAHCLYNPALIDNLERHWDAKRRVS